MSTTVNLVSGVFGDGDEGYRHATGFAGGAIGDVYIGDVNSSLYDVVSFHLFKSVAIPQGAVVVSATFSLQARGWAGSPTVTIEAEDSDDATEPTSQVDMDGRARTSASVDWTPASWSGRVNAPDVSTVVQEVVDRAGWASGNDLLFFVRLNPNPAGWPGTAKYLNSAGINRSTQWTAHLDITYDDPPAGQHESGGSHATVTVTPAGAGTATEAASGGSTATVAVTATGEGVARQVAYWSDPVTVEVGGTTFPWLGPGERPWLGAGDDEFLGV